MAFHDKKRVSVKIKKPNPLFEKWLEEWKVEAEQSGLKSHHTFATALKHLRKYPVVLKSGKDCGILIGFGKKLCSMLDDKLNEYRKLNPQFDTSRRNDPLDNIENHHNLSQRIEKKPNSPKKASTKNRKYVPKQQSTERAVLLLMLKESQKSDYAGYTRKDKIIEQISDKFPNTLLDLPALNKLINEGLIFTNASSNQYSLTDDGLDLATNLFMEDLNGMHETVNVEKPLERTTKSGSETDKNKDYFPKWRSGGYAILVAMWTESQKENYCGYVLKEDLINAAKPHCDKSFTKPDPGSFYTAWSSMSTLISKGLVSKKRCPAQFSLTDYGKDIASKLFYTLRKETISGDDAENSMPFNEGIGNKLSDSLPSSSSDKSDSFTERKRKSDRSELEKSPKRKTDTLSDVKLKILDVLFKKSQENDVYMSENELFNNCVHICSYFQFSSLMKILISDDLISCKNIPVQYSLTDKGMDIAIENYCNGDTQNRIRSLNNIDKNSVTGEGILRSKVVECDYESSSTNYKSCGDTSAIINELIDKYSNKQIFSRVSIKNEVVETISLDSDVEDDDSIRSATVNTCNVSEELVRVPVISKQRSDEIISTNGNVQKDLISVIDTYEISSSSEDDNLVNSNINNENKQCLGVSEENIPKCNKIRSISDGSTNFDEEFLYEPAVRKQKQVEQISSSESDEDIRTVNVHKRQKNSVANINDKLLQKPVIKKRKHIERISSSESDEEIRYNKICDKQISSNDFVLSNQKNDRVLDLKTLDFCTTQNIDTNYRSEISDPVKNNIDNVFGCTQSKNSNYQSQKSTSDGVVFLPNRFEIILLVDTHETSGKNVKNDATVTELDRLKVKYEVCHLNVGDFTWICRDEQNKELLLPFIVERKRMDDLGSSIKDGRYHEQKFRLKRSGIKNLIYLIESYGNNKHTGLPVTSLYQAATNTNVQDNFTVKYTSCHKNSMEYIVRLTKFLIRLYKGKTLKQCSKTDMLQTPTENDIIPLLSFSEFNSDAKKDRDLNVRQLFIRQLLQLKGMSLDKAAAITKLYPTPLILYQHYRTITSAEGEKLLSSIKSANRCIGPVISKTIYKFYTNMNF